MSAMGACSSIGCSTVSEAPWPKNRDPDVPRQGLYCMATGSTETGVAEISPPASLVDAFNEGHANLGYDDETKQATSATAAQAMDS